MWVTTLVLLAWVVGFLQGTFQTYYVMTKTKR